MRLVRPVAALLCLLVWLVPTSVLAHDGVSGTPDVTVRITGAGVSDHSVAVPVGGIVAFVNQDDERHRMRSRTEPGEFDTGDIEPGGRYLVRFSTAGSVGYADERSDRGVFTGTIEVRAASSGGGSGPGGAGGSGGTGGGTSTTKPPTTASITIGDRVFSPGTVTVATGGTVTWTNRDDREHTATSTGGGSISSPVLGTGQSYRKTFSQAGTFAFLCAIHPDMRGTVKVVGAAGAGGGGATPAPTPKPTPKPTPAATTAPATAPGVVEAGIVDFAFEPAPITIEAGGTVTWVNRGAAPHTVTASDGSFDSELLAAGASFSREFATPGSHAFVCAFHPEMRGTVTVTAGSGTTAAAPTTPAPSASPIASPTPAPSSTPGPAAVVVPPASTQSPTSGEAAPVASASDPTSTFGQLLPIGLVVILNVGAVLLFAKTIGGAMRKPA